MAENYSVKPIGKSQVELTVTLDSDIVEENYGKQLAKYAKELQIDGFRKGKAPISVLERKYGEIIRKDATFECIEKQLFDIVDTLGEKERPLPYSTPELQNQKELEESFKKGENIVFSVIYDVMPTFDLPKYTGLSFEYEAYEVQDSDIDERIKELQERNAMILTKDGEIENGDIVTLDYVQLDEKGEEVPSTSRTDFTFTVGSGKNYYQIDKEILGLKAGDEKKFDKSYAEDFENGDLAGKTITLRVKIQAVKYKEIPEVDDEFAEDIKEEYKSVQDLKDGIKAEMEEQLSDFNDNQKMQAIMKELVAKTDIEIPSSMLNAQLEDNWRRNFRQSGVTEEQMLQYLALQGETKESIFESWKEGVSENLKQQLILQAIQEKEKVQVDEEEAKAEADKYLKEDTDEDTRRAYVRQIKDQLEFEMVPKLLLAQNEFTAKETHSFKEYENLVRLGR